MRSQWRCKASERHRHRSWPAVRRIQSKSRRSDESVLGRLPGSPSDPLTATYGPHAPRATQLGIERVAQSARRPSVPSPEQVPQTPVTAAPAHPSLETSYVVDQLAAGAGQATVCSRDRSAASGPTLTSPLSPNRQHDTGLLLRASSIDVDARVTPLDPPGNPKGAPTGAARLSAAGYQRLRRSVSTSTAVRSRSAQLGEATVSLASADTLLPRQEPAHQQTTKSAAIPATRQQDDGRARHTGCCFGRESVSWGSVRAGAGDHGRVDPNRRMVSRETRCGSAEW